MRDHTPSIASLTRSLFIKPESNKLLINWELVAPEQYQAILAKGLLNKRCVVKVIELEVSEGPRAD